MKYSLIPHVGPVSDVMGVAPLNEQQWAAILTTEPGE